MRRRLTIAVLLVGLSAAARAQTPEYRVIVNAANPVSRLTSEQVTRYFLDRGAQWSDGSSVAAVDQSARSAIRDVFSRRVMGRTVDQVVNHWKERLLGEGQPPPPVKGSDADVIEFVAKKKNAVGYVGAAVTLPPTVKVVAVVD